MYTNMHAPGIGAGMVTISVFVSLYYNILVAYILFFFFASMTDGSNHDNTVIVLLKMN